MKWDKRFIQLARHVASWSKDPSTQCGAVIVGTNNHVVSIGYNGFPRHIEDTNERLQRRETKLQYIVHAEANAILTAHEQLKDYAIYVWPFQPCCHCAAAIIQSGIKEVYCPDVPAVRWTDSFDVAKKMFSEADILLNLVDDHIPNQS